MQQRRGLVKVDEAATEINCYILCEVSSDGGLSHFADFDEMYSFLLCRAFWCAREFTVV